jgi:ParB family chromosome partitioning protein
MAKKQDDGLTTSGYNGELPLDLIRENADALREVNTESEEFQEIKQSVISAGVLNPIVVRELSDEEGNFYGLIDGAHRTAAARLAGLKTIPARIMVMTDAQVWEAQMIANAQNIPTSKTQYAKNILRILSANPILSVSALAADIGKSGKWLYSQLSLTKLHPQVQELVDNGDIHLIKAYTLSKLPQEEQLEMIDSAMTDPPDVFADNVTARVKEIRDARRAGRKEGPPEYTHKPRLRKVAHLEEMLSDKEACKTLLDACNVKSIDAAFTLGVQYAMTSDPISKKNLEEEFNNKQKQKAQEKKEREAARAAAAAKLASEKAAEKQKKADAAKKAVG